MKTLKDRIDQCPTMDVLVKLSREVGELFFHEHAMDMDIVAFYQFNEQIIKKYEQLQKKKGE